MNPYDKLHNGFPAYKSQPIIGITGNYGEKGCELADGYYRSVIEAGGVPLVIPPFAEGDSLLSLLDRIDGLMLSGGADINPLLLGEQPIPALHGINPQRDAQELLLVQLACDRQIPILGICRGIQVLTAALGGTLRQDIYTTHTTPTYAAESWSGSPLCPLIKHSQDAPRHTATHTVSICPDSTLYNIMRTRELPVNSFHHQAVCQPGRHLRITAQSSDGVVEAVESCEQKSILGVQWHPECFILNADRSMMPLFEWLVGEANTYRKARSIHQRILTLDSHEDTPMFFAQGVRFDHRDDHVLVDLHKMQEGGLDAGIMVAYLPQKERDEAGLQAATHYANSVLDQLEAMVNKHPEACSIAHTPDDLYRLKHEGRKAIMMGIENGYAIGKDLALLKHFRQRGIVYMTLCHNGDNDICDSARGQQEHGGLSHFGEEVVSEMNRLGMMIDLSHAAESTFWDVLRSSRQPVVCSHSSCRALCDHPRNLTDHQMRALAAQGGVMQVTIYNGFLRSDGEATLADVVRHIQHAVEVMGIEHVGIGTDFDGDGGVPGCASASELLALTCALLRAGFDEEALRLIWGENFLRVMRQVQQATMD
ncbi:MAG: membrane dipeptidase [Bacteroidales bacterium]|nr:membrane dipeptidase [Candidatus Physcousia equi]